jgi:hypothetical protein
MVTVDVMEEECFTLLLWSGVFAKRWRRETLLWWWKKGVLVV